MCDPSTHGAKTGRLKQVLGQSGSVLTYRPAWTAEMILSSTQTLINNCYNNNTDAEMPAHPSTFNPVLSFA